MQILPQTSDYDEITNRLVWKSIRPVSVFLGFLFISLMIGHLLLLDSWMRINMATIAGCTSIILFILARYFTRIPFAKKRTYPIAFGIVSLASSNGLAYLFLTGEIEQTINLVILIIGSGFFLLSLRWLLLALALTCSGWIVFILPGLNYSYELPYGIVLLSSSLLAIILNRIQLRILINQAEPNYKYIAQLEQIQKPLLSANETKYKLETIKQQCQEMEDKTQKILNQEFELGARIQSNLLPKTLPKLPGYDIFSKSIAARIISGDYHDFLPLDSDNFQVALADIAGKGIPAALLTSTTRAMIHVESDDKHSPSELLCLINNQLYDDLTNVELIITLFICQLKSSSSHLTYASAGHGQALIWKNLTRNYIELQATGLPIGVVENTTYDESNFTIDPGDILLIYSDGVTEAINPQNEQFGISRLIELVKKYAEKSSNQLVEAIFEAINSFICNEEIQDDISIIAIKALLNNR